MSSGIMVIFVINKVLSDLIWWKVEIEVWFLEFWVIVVFNELYGIFINE